MIAFPWVKAPVPAITRQLEADLLAELSGALTAEHGPIPEQLAAEAWAAWPDAE